MIHPHEPPPGTQLARLDELAKSGCVEREFGPAHERFRLVVLSVAGHIHAFENRCPHFSIPLNYEPGRFWVYDGSTLMCAHHSAMFHLDSGLCFDGPCQGARLRRLEIEIGRGAVWRAADLSCA
jgi:nitrite reductase/ring-hydroxylating ferredoxin subunit